MERVNISSSRATATEVYVDPDNGDDLNPGTEASPVATLLRARQLASTTEPATVWVAATASSIDDGGALSVLWERTKPLRFVSLADWETIEGDFTIGTGTTGADLVVDGTSPAWGTDEFFSANGSGGGFIEIASSSNSALVGLRRLIGGNTADTLHLVTELPAVPPSGTIFRVVRPGGQIIAAGGLVGPGMTGSRAGDYGWETFLAFEGFRIEHTGTNAASTGVVMALGCELIANGGGGWGGWQHYHGHLALGWYSGIFEGQTEEFFEDWTPDRLLGYGSTVSTTVAGQWAGLQIWFGRIFGYFSTFGTAGFLSLGAPSSASWRGGRIVSIYSYNGPNNLQLGSSTSSGGEYSYTALKEADLWNAEVTIFGLLNFGGSSKDFRFGRRTVARLEYGGFVDYAGEIIVDSGAIARIGGSWVDGANVPAGGFTIGEINPVTVSTLAAGQSFEAEDGSRIYRIGEAVAKPSEVYVDNTSGNDTNDGSSGSPVETIARALEIGGPTSLTITLVASATEYDASEVEGIFDPNRAIVLQGATYTTIATFSAVAGTNTTLQASVDPGWTTDEHAGRFASHPNGWYPIRANSNDTLYLAGDTGSALSGSISIVETNATVYVSQAHTEGVDTTIRRVHCIPLTAVEVGFNSSIRLADCYTTGIFFGTQVSVRDGGELVLDGVISPTQGVNILGDRGSLWIENVTTIADDFDVSADLCKFTKLSGVLSAVELTDCSTRNTGVLDMAELTVSGGSFVFEEEATVTGSITAVGSNTLLTIEEAISADKIVALDGGMIKCVGSWPSTDPPTNGFEVGTTTAYGYATAATLATPGDPASFIFCESDGSRIYRT